MLDNVGRVLGKGTYLIVLFLFLLMPFHFQVPHSLGAALAGFWGSDLGSVVGSLHVVMHLLLFIPIGVWVYVVGLRQGRRARHFALAAAIFLALLGESAQLFVARGVSLSDMLINCGGIALGLWLGHRYQKSATFKARIDRLTATPVLVGGLVLASILLLVGITPFFTSWKTWDTHYPLLVGNENTGDRPWLGTIYEVAIFDRVLSQEEIKQFSHSSWPEHIEAPTVHYLFSSENLVLEDDTLLGIEGEVGREERLVSMQDEAGALELVEGGLRIKQPATLRSEQPPNALYEAIVASGAMTIFARLKVKDLKAWGPGRIVGLSNDPYSQNVMLGQTGDSLQVRVRNTSFTKSGWPLELVTDGGLRGNTQHAVVVVCTEARTALYLDGKLQKRLAYNLLNILINRVFGSVMNGRIVVGLLFIYISLLTLLFYRLLSQSDRLHRWRHGAVVLAAFMVASLVGMSRLIEYFLYG